MCSWTRPAHRFLSTSSLNLQVLDAWIASPKSLGFTDTFHSNHLSDLYITLPTRDGTREGSPLGYGHHLAFFHPRNPEVSLRADGTDADFCPPEPFTRRMWAGGTMAWNNDQPLRVGEKATAVSTVAKVEKKGFEVGKPMIFVKQRIEVTVEGQSKPGMVEERAHVYQASVVGRRRVPRQVNDLPKSEFSLSYTPTLTTLFRFLLSHSTGITYTWTRIMRRKLKDIQVKRLVHGPLTALLLLESLVYHRPKAQLRTFSYRAHNPIFVNCPATIHGAMVAKDKAELWCENDEGVVGMTGVIQFDE
ncbi:hypothetical protein BDR07DRAFT_1419598 [Suillus spraguei]|nr:hypothetical protein BDR07DRAFT_1419598 [Suillus spraguei]